jgi:hypothetical protein
MKTDDTPSRPQKRCYNCSLPCNGMFCCDWCMDAYLARRDADRAARRRQTPEQPDQRSTPEANRTAGRG